MRRNAKGLMKQITINIGTEHRADGLPLTERERLDGMRAIERDAMAVFNGVTVIPTWGGWRNPAGEVVTEEGLQVEILTDSPTAHADALTLAQHAKEHMRQQSVLLRVQDVAAEFV